MESRTLQEFVDYLQTSNFGQSLAYIAGQADACATILFHEGWRVNDGESVSFNTLTGLSDILREVAKRAEEAQEILSYLTKNPHKIPINPAEMAAATKTPEVQ